MNTPPVSSATPEPVFERLVRIETKLDVANQSDADREGRLRKLEAEIPQGAIQDHEQRIRRLERSVWVATGMAAALGGTAGTLIAQLVSGALK